MLLAFIMGMNILIFFVVFSPIDSFIVRNLGYMQTVKFHIFLYDYSIPILGYALGTLIVMTGVRLLITRKGESNLGLALVGMPVVFLALSLLERWGWAVFLNAPVAS